MAYGLYLYSALSSHYDPSKRNCVDCNGWDLTHNLPIEGQSHYLAATVSYPSRKSDDMVIEQFQCCMDLQ